MPVVGVLLSLANLLSGSGVLLESFHERGNSYLYYQIADWTVIAGFTAIWLAIKIFFVTPKMAWWMLASPLLLEVAATAFVRPDPSSYLARALIFNAMCAFVFLACFVDLYKGLSKTMNWIRTLAMSWPLLLTGLVFALRRLQIAGAAIVDDITLQDSTLGFANYLWVLIAMLIMVNVTMIKVVVNDLIAELKSTADHDVLTGVFNRRFVMHMLHLEIERTLRTARPLSCIVLDTDHFKLINDRYGHDAGDVALQHVCQVLTQGLRITDTLGRQGGEEFMLICPDTPHATAIDVAERLRLALQSHPLEIEGNSLVLTASFGVGTLRPEDTLESLLKKSDLALYRSKRLGRNRVSGESSASSQ